jgi:hypothetical protein
LVGSTGAGEDKSEYKSTTDVLGICEQH